MPLTVKSILRPLSLDPVAQSFYRLVNPHGIDHVQVMEAHRSRIVIAHDDTARGTRVENLSVVEVLAAVVCSALFDHRAQSAVAC
jgi:hypothetical protein